jgi:adenosylcobinamide-phosphate synthase
MGRGRADRQGARARSWASGPQARALADAVGLAAGYALDRVVRDPRRLHPVAGFGRFATALERRTYAPDRAAGARYTAIAVGVPVMLAGAAAFATRRRPVARAVLTALTTWTVLGGASLRREAQAMADSLDAADVAAARRRLPHLCGRDPSTLDKDELVRASVESVAENTSDAEVAPLIWGALAGMPGLVGYRAINTLDAMVGHRSERYARFGTVAARVDDLANLAPSRATAALTVAAASTVGGSSSRALWVWLRHGHRHPSPNAGQCEAAMAGALDIRLGGRNVYSGQIADRPRLGSGRGPTTDDLRRAARLSSVIGVLAATLCVGHVLARPWRQSGGHSRGQSRHRRPA